MPPSNLGYRVFFFFFSLLLLFFPRSHTSILFNIFFFGPQFLSSFL